VQNNGEDSKMYANADYQGSLIALTNESGAVVEKYAYDPWGARRDPTNWQLKDTRTSFITNRGYIGHEHLDAFGIINMNGRVYDPLTAMFFSPDPFIQSPGDWKNYNRYGYCMNNPTRYTDPTGYTYNTIFQAVGDLMKSENGGTWTSGGGGYGNTESFSSGDEALSWGSAYNDYMGSWGNTDYHGRNESIQNYNLERDFRSGKVALVGFKLDDNQYYMAYLDNVTGKFYNMNTNIETDPYSEYNIYNVSDKSGNSLDNHNWVTDTFGDFSKLNYSIYTKEENDRATNVMLVVAVGGLAAGTGAAALLGKGVITAGTYVIRNPWIIPGLSGFVEGTIKSNYSGPDPESSNSIFMNPVSDFSMNVTEIGWNYLTIINKNPLPSYP